MTIVLNSVEIGFPRERPRGLGVVGNQRTMARAGPAGWQRRLKEMTCRSCQTTGAEYFAAEDAERLVEYRLLAAKQKNYPTDASLHGCRAQDIAEIVLAGQARVRLEDYLALKHERQSLGGVFICDLLGPERRRQLERMR